MVLFMYKYSCKEMDFENHRITLASIHIILRNQSRSERWKKLSILFLILYAAERYLFECSG